MSLTRRDVENIAHLARLAISEAQLPVYAESLSKILSFVEQLNEVNVDSVEAMTTPVPIKLPMREDVVSDGDIRDQVLANAPKSEDGFFVVPKVVE